MSVVTRAPSRGARQFGHVLAAVITGIMWWAINVWPGWEALPFLTGQTPEVLRWVNVSLAASIVANLVYVMFDPRWFKALGDLVTTAISLIATVLVWQVFPFDFSTYSFNWAVVVRFILAIVIFGSIVGIVAQLVTLIRVTLSGGSSSVAQ